MRLGLLALGLVLASCRSSAPSLDDPDPTGRAQPKPADVSAPATAEPAAPTPATKEPAMPFSDDVLPSKLSVEQLDKVEVRYSFMSPKTGAGRQELHIKGSGEVKLLRTMAYDQPEELREGQAPADAARRMLEVMEDEGFFTLEDEYEQEPPHGGTFIVQVVFPGGQAKSVAVDVVPDHRPPDAFARAVGAIKLVAGLATPEALHHRFLPTL
ncbi:MAG: hypothetical protein AAF799_34340 [Myxococcota bacterium]